VRRRLASFRGGEVAGSCLLWDCASGNLHREWAIDCSNGKKLECAIVLGCRKITESLPKDGAIDDCAEIPATPDGTAPSGRIRASTTGGIQRW